MAFSNFQRAFLLTLVSGSSALVCLTWSDGSAAIGKPILTTSKIAAANSPTTSDVSMKNVKDVVHRLRTATLDLINDVEQRDMVVTGSPDIIQPIAYDDKKPIGWAREMLELGPALPPRKQWLDLDMAHISELIKLLNDDISQLTTGSATVGSDEMKTVMQDVQTHYQTLTDLTKGPKYDNLAIGKAALAIYDDMAKFNKPWKDMLKSKTTSN